MWAVSSWVVKLSIWSVIEYILYDPSSPTLIVNSTVLESFSGNPCGDPARFALFLLSEFCLLVQKKTFGKWQTWAHVALAQRYTLIESVNQGGRSLHPSDLIWSPCISSGSVCIF